MCCTISYQKCVCFVFLVVLAVLSCSGFRIDNLAMTDVSKRNSHAAASPGLLEALFANSTHRLRHRRQMTGGHDASSRGTKRRPQCPEVDASWKAATADAVAVAVVDSKSANCRPNCIVQFKIHKWLKNGPSSRDELIRLEFRTERHRCEDDDATPYFLVKPKEYILFLRTDGLHNYRAAYAPELNRPKTLKAVNKTCGTNFRPKPLRLDVVPVNTTHSKRLKLACKVRGFPIPVITWKKNNTILQPNHRIRITQKKRKSTLLITRSTEADWGQYECSVRSVDGKSLSRTINKERPGKPCPGDLKNSFCFNGGTCFFTELMGEYSCLCPDGFHGRQCSEKSSKISMYPQTPISTCKVGLYTNYDNC